MMLLGQAGQDVSFLMDLTALDLSPRTEHRGDTLAQGLRSINDDHGATVRPQATTDEVLQQARDHLGFFRRPRQPPRFSTAAYTSKALTEIASVPACFSTVQADASDREKVTNAS